MLELRPNCECCDKDLPPESTEARICTLECTCCASCAYTVLHGICPNCGGELLRVPSRTAGKLIANPASTTRIHQPGGCPQRPGWSVPADNRKSCQKSKNAVLHNCVPTDPPHHP